MVKSKHVPVGWPTVIPRIAVDEPEALVKFIQHVFGAVGRFRPERPSELRIGDSMVMVGTTVDRRAMPAFLYVYVEDRDRVFSARWIVAPSRSKSPRTCRMATVAPWFGIPGAILGRSLPIVGVSHGKLSPDKPIQRRVLRAAVDRRYGAADCPGARRR
jgi:hypothetical protein